MITEETRKKLQPKFLEWIEKQGCCIKPSYNYAEFNIICRYKAKNDVNMKSAQNRNMCELFRKEYPNDTAGSHWRITIEELEKFMEKSGKFDRFIRKI